MDGRRSMIVKYSLIGGFIALFISVGAQQNFPIKFEQIPFKANNYSDQIAAITQDTLGLVWLFGNNKWFVSDGYEVEKVSFPFLTNTDELVRGFYGKTEEGYFYFGGNKVRFFDPYSTKITQAIPISKDVQLNDAKPYLYNVAFSNDSLIWAVYAPLNHLNLPFPGYTIMQSRKGAPFRPVGIARKTGLLNSQDMTVRGDDLFISAVDSILQYDTSGQLVKAYLLPKTGTKPLAANLVVTLSEDIHFLHYGYNATTKQYDRALYTLKANDTIVNHLTIPDLNGIAITRINKTKEVFWIRGGGSLGYFSQTSPNLVSISEADSGNSDVFEDWSGTIWLGNDMYGVLQLSEEKLSPVNRHSRVSLQLANFKLFDSKSDTLIALPLSARLDTVFHLEHGQNFLEIDIFISDYRDISAHRFSYWLEGYDRDWSPASSGRKIKYNRLNAGTYVLHLRAYLNDKSDTYFYKRLTISVKQLWYKTWWAVSLFILIVMGVAYGVYRMFQFQLARQLKSIEAIKQQELQVLKERLYTNFIHEFRTPLTVIMGMTQNIRGHSKEKRLIYRNSQNLLRLVNQMLDFAKSQSGELQLQLTHGNIIGYLQYLTESVHSMAEEKNIQVTFYSEVSEKYIDFDEEKVQYILYNLLTNALKFTPEKGTIIVHVNEMQEKQTSYLLIKVKDNGIGIEGAALPKIFDRFYQVESLEKLTNQGTGLGLAFTKEIIQFLNGKIEVESKVGLGSTFSVSLPIIPGTGKSIPKKIWKTGPNIKETTEPPFSITPSFQKDLLLIVEDNLDVVEYIKGIVNAKFEVLIAKNGVEGVNIAIEKSPDIIISDVMMPQMDGFALCETLKTDDRTSHIPIILLTAKVATSSRLEGLEKGADAYLVKPFQREELLIRIEKLLDLRKRLQQHFNATASLLEDIRKNQNPTSDERFIQSLLKLIQSRLGDPDLSIPDLCRAVKRSNTHVNRKLKMLTGKTPSQFIRFVRLQHALELLKTSDLNISEIAYRVGFANPNYFSRAFSEEFGMAPSEIRK